MQCWQTPLHRNAEILMYKYVIMFDENVIQRGWKLASCRRRKELERVKRHSYNIARTLVNGIISRRSQS